MPGGTALFGCSASRSSSKNLVEFKAGKMTMKGKMVHPDKRKGLVYIYQSEDSLMHFCWKDRNTGSVEDDLIIFPDDVEFKRVPQCTTGRVYILKFKSSSRKFFFWIQEPKTDKDEDNCRKVNEVLNNPPSLGSQRSGGATPDGDLQNLLSNMSQQQLMQLFGGVGQIGGLSSLLGTMSQSSPRSGGSSNSSSSAAAAAVSSSPSVGNTSTTATTTPAASSQQTTPSTPKTPSTPANSGVPTATPQAPAKPPSNPIQLRQLQTYLSGLGMQATGQGSSTPPTGVDLSTSLTAEGLQAVLNNPEFVREVQRHLPPVSANGSSQQDLLRSTLASPQFQQAVSMFSTALQSGQLGPVMSQFDVGPDAVSAANQGNMEEFVRALQAASISVQQQQQQQQQPQPPQQQEGQNTSVQGSDVGTATGDSAQRSTTEASSDNKDKKDEEEEMNLD
ncbi:regulatory particle non-ATPase 13 [Rhodnius prolixus]|uniref:regulatory particle non-ATPase 13 n=1 Tax=Rhodnius prolixus TaxID=13249 RepID=UPI003D18D910